MALFWDYFAAKSLISSLSRRVALQRSSTYFLFIPALSYTLSLYWEHCVSKLVPKPYLDEVFHIRQAQAYCHGNYTVWDPKITTPPALYVFAATGAVLTRAFSKQFCSIHQLRLFNCHALLLTFYYAYGCRRRIVRKWARNRYLLDVDALHTAFNITLFPPLFFFSGLFYTDVLSTCCVLVSYKLYLERNDERTNLRLNLLCSFIIGIVCLLIRQTNIFWVAIFLGALQLVDTIKLHQIKEEILKSSIIRNQYISKFLKEYCILKLHDPSLEEAGVFDFLQCALSIINIIIYQPAVLASIVTNFWLLVFFGLFIYWNDGVVLGDKSNHVATIHLPQMLYLWPLITFFSAPLLIPAGISFFRRLNHQIPRHVFISISWSNLQSALHITGGLIVCLATIKYNTIIHPFTLADNRHYMFYIFRYSILCHPAIRFLLAPIYAICSALVYKSLCFPAQTIQKKKCSSSSLVQPSDVSRQEKSAGRIPTTPTVSFAIALFGATTLSLVSAPLVEPRYFITCWVLWRLNIPMNLSKELVSENKTSDSRTNNLFFKALKKPYSSMCHKKWLWLETTWLILINFITGYIFLHKGFEWPQEPGNVQRFMW
ncbi:unnamed protein product [Blumeria hordei]|uniref:Dol-P-Glc:Glc(2)Man(9)GlcNAc(2)-PP-Dol alpha-1,2-glucosyltransferase n=1 Tax=Blumeria hordei TaxID=2867405 RepID=A0A383UVK0_BLUHO|nr:unnamed protein product [Blumeria hordei]